jgi:hypothetical protein
MAFYRFATAAHPTELQALKKFLVAKFLWGANDTFLHYIYPTTWGLVIQRKMRLSYGYCKHPLKSKEFNEYCSN